MLPRLLLYKGPKIFHFNIPHYFCDFLPLVLAGRPVVVHGGVSESPETLLSNNIKVIILTIFN